MTTANYTQENAIATYSYVRKSTKGEVECADGSKKERQEKSIEQQRQELDKLPFPHELKHEGFDGFAHAGTFADEGISGWKLGSDRPGFLAMTHAIQSNPAKQKAIVVDNIDRFSRANIEDTLAVARVLKQAGVKWIISAAQGVYSIGNGNDLVEHLKFAIAASMSHEYSRQLGRRIALAKRNKAADGKRSGGCAPFALVCDGKGGLMHGDPEQVKIVRRIFDLFVTHGWSTCKIADQFNDEKIPAAKGGLWYAHVVRKMLKNPAYNGVFQYGVEGVGRFYQIAPNGDVIESHGQYQPAHAPAFTAVGVYVPIVTQTIFQSAQRRLAGFKQGRKPRHNGFTLSRVLKCDHCGEPLIGTLVDKIEKNKVVGKIPIYRCQTSFKPGVRACEYYRVREDEILPDIMRLLDEEIDALTAQTLTPEPPPQSPAPDHAAEIASLKKRIATAEDRILDIADKRTRNALDVKITAMRNELDALTAKQQPPADAVAAQQLKAWWAQTKATLTQVPIPASGKIAKTLYPAVSAYVTAWGDATFMVDVDKRAINEVLHQLGAEVRLRWRTVERVQRKRYFLDRGRFLLGRKDLELAPSATGTRILITRNKRGSRAEEAIVSQRERTDSLVDPQRSIFG